MANQNKIKNHLPKRPKGGVSGNLPSLFEEALAYAEEEGTCGLFS